MAVTVIYHVPSTVKTVYVKGRMEHALHVILDGLENIVKQVRLTIIVIYEDLQLTIIIFMKLTRR